MRNQHKDGGVGGFVLPKSFFKANVANMQCDRGGAYIEKVKPRSSSATSTLLQSLKNIYF